MQENPIRELTASDFVTIQHILGDRNMSELFIKEDINITHLKKIRDTTMAYPPIHNTIHTSYRAIEFFNIIYTHK